MIDDLWTSLKAQLYERTTSPLLATLSVSWLAWNHRLFFVLFSSGSVSERFSYIDGVLYPDPKTTFLFGFLYPVLTAVVFLFVYPYPARGVFKFWRERQKELKEIRQKIEDETPLTREESRQLRRRMTELRLEYHKQSEQSSEEANQLRAMVTKEQEEKEALHQELEELRAQISRETPLGSDSDEGPDYGSDEGDLTVVLGMAVTRESLLEYARLRFPGKSPSEDLTDTLLEDLDLGRYDTIADIDGAVNAAEPAVRAYEKENPQVFRFGTDHITKSLGFADATFREQHGFSARTRKAFERHQDKVKAGRNEDGTHFG